MVTKTESRVPRRWAPYVVVVAALAIALAASGAPSPTYIDFQDLWGLSSLALTLAYAAYGGGVIVALLTTGGISDRVGRTPVLVVSLVILAIAMQCFILAANLPTLILARLVQGTATGMLTGAASAALTETHPYSDTTAAAATNSMTTSMAIALGALLSGAVLDLHVGLRAPFVILLVLSLFIAVLVLVLSPGRRVDRAGSLLKFQRLSVPSGMRSEFVMASLCVTAAWGVGGLYLALGGSIAASLLNLHGHLVSGIVILAVQGVGAVVQFVWIRFKPNLSPQQSIVVAITALGVGTVSTAVGAALVWPWLAVTGALISGVGFGLAFMVGTGVVSMVAPESRLSEVIAAYFVVAYLAISVPAIGVSFLIMIVGDIAAFMIFTIVIVLLCLLIGLMIAVQTRANRRVTSNV